MSKTSVSSPLFEIMTTSKLPRLIPPQGIRNGSAEPFLVCLGRHGDLINVLPLVARLSAFSGRPVPWVVSEEFASTLEGASYVRPIPVQCDYGKPLRALQIARSRGMTGKAYIAQANGFYRLPVTESYQTDAWEAAGMRGEFQRLPVDFDRRDNNRESKLVAETLDGRPAVLVALCSVSSPIALPGFIEALQREVPECQFVDMSNVRAERLYDVLGLLDEARLLVTVDSSLLHLSRASDCPVFAIRNDGWKGSVLPPGTVGGLRYTETSLESLLEAVLREIHGILKPRRVVHVTDAFWPDARHMRAKQACDSVPGLIRVASQTTASRSSANFGHPKRLPFLRDILEVGLAASNPGDAVIWTNSDIALTDEINPWSERATPFGMVTMRRNENGHCGRDLMLFSHEWLKDNLKTMPDYVIGAPIFDLGLACMARYRRGIKSRMANMALDFPPCDAAERLCLHEPHPQTWENDSPAARHNGAEFSKWLKTHAPDMGWT